MSVSDEVWMLTLLGEQPDGSQVAIGCACVREDDNAFYGYPGDVVYSKSDWRLIREESARSWLAWQAELEQRWRDGPGRRFS